MSENQAAECAWHGYIQDMLDFSEKVLAYTDGLDERAFFTGALTYDATIHNILLIGEAASNIPLNVRQARPTIPWGEIIGTRNRVVHSYRELNQSVIWKIIQMEIPALIPQLRKLLEDVQQEEG